MGILNQSKMEAYPSESIGITMRINDLLYIFPQIIRWNMCNMMNHQKTHIFTIPNWGLWGQHPSNLGRKMTTFFFSGWLLGWFMASATDATGMEWSRVAWSAVNWGLPLVIKHGWNITHLVRWFSMIFPVKTSIFIVKFPASHDDTAGVPNLAEPSTTLAACRRPAINIISIQVFSAYSEAVSVVYKLEVLQ